MRMEYGRPTGAYEDFMTVFFVNNEAVLGRPDGVAAARDRSLVVSDNANSASSKGHARITSTRRFAHLHRQPKRAH